ncbi:unnamed protein product [Caenorhabditis sp. 36 PRJEB53466]|nr:unnamed protein product [Caenorhabditis sp. 36 PRJEB53466]
MDVTVLSREEDVAKDEEIEIMIRSAKAALKLGMFEEGLARFEEILECGTSNFRLLSTIYMWYGRTCRKLKYNQKALEFFEHEVNTYRLTGNFAAACDASRRIAELSLKMGKFSKAKRTAEDMLDYATSKREGEQFIRQARLLITSVYLEGFERNMEKNPDENKRLLKKSNEHIMEMKLLSEDAVDIEILMLEAKHDALSGDLRKARDIYHKCIDLGVKTKQFAFVHRAYFEMASFAEGGALLCIVNDLRSALFYAEKYGTQSEIAHYKVDLAQKMLVFGSTHEAYLVCTEALESSRKISSIGLITVSLLTISKCLIILGERNQAAYFIVLGSVLFLEKERTQKEENPENTDFHQFYSQIDDLMTSMKEEVAEGTEVQLQLDASVDSVPNEMVAKFIVKLEHTTTVETWRMMVNEMINEARKPMPEETKENEKPLDFMELLEKMNNRMDDQRTELPAAVFNRPRPLSSASSRKTIKSHRILPGLRANINKLQDMRIDRSALSRILKRQKKSKVSIHSNSTQGEDTRSDVTADDSIMTTSK